MLDCILELIKLAQHRLVLPWFRSQVVVCRVALLQARHRKLDVRAALIRDQCLWKTLDCRCRALTCTTPLKVRCLISLKSVDHLACKHDFLFEQFVLLRAQLKLIWRWNLWDMHIYGFSFCTLKDCLTLWTLFLTDLNLHLFVDFLDDLPSFSLTCTFLLHLSIWRLNVAELCLENATFRYSWWYQCNLCLRDLLLSFHSLVTNSHIKRLRVISSSLSYIACYNIIAMLGLVTLLGDNLSIDDNSIRGWIDSRRSHIFCLHRINKISDGWDLDAC